MQYLLLYILISAAPSWAWQIRLLWVFYFWRQKSGLLSTFTARSTKLHCQVVLFVVVNGWRRLLPSSLKWPCPLDYRLTHPSWEQIQIEGGSVPSASTNRPYRRRYKAMQGDKHSLKGPVVQWLVQRFRSERLHVRSRRSATFTPSAHVRRQYLPVWPLTLKGKFAP